MDVVRVGVTAPIGFKASGLFCGIKKLRKDIALVVSDVPAVAAAMFTTNTVVAAPVVVDREQMARGGKIRAIVVNSGNANACTGERGLDDAWTMVGDTAEALGISKDEVLVSSTGVIGQYLPMDVVRPGVRAAAEHLGPDGSGAAEAIRTTDTFAKEAAVRCAIDGTRVTVGGMAKGSGMIAPNMATMLAFVATDAPVDAGGLPALLRDVAVGSFNAVHVDSHPSTNDSLFLLATRRGTQEKAFSNALRDTCRRLAWLIARDGEGATKVTTIRVTGASSNEAAQAIGRRVAESALVRTALFGNDPNWGRFVSQVGNAKEVTSVAGLVCKVQGITVFENEAPTRFDRAEASKAMAAEDVLLELALTEGSGAGDILTSDLGYRYVEVNAEYTT